MFYDPMIAKLVTRGRRRARPRSNAQVDSTRPVRDRWHPATMSIFSPHLVQHPRFREGQVSQRTSSPMNIPKARSMARLPDFRPATDRGSDCDRRGCFGDDRRSGRGDQRSAWRTTLFWFSVRAASPRSDRREEPHRVRIKRSQGGTLAVTPDDSGDLRRYRSSSARIPDRPAG